MQGEFGAPNGGGSSNHWIIDKSKTAERKRERKEIHKGRG